MPQPKVTRTGRYQPTKQEIGSGKWEKGKDGIWHKKKNIPKEVRKEILDFLKSSFKQIPMLMMLGAFPNLKKYIDEQAEQEEPCSSILTK